MSNSKMKEFNWTIHYDSDKERMIVYKKMEQLGIELSDIRVFGNKDFKSYKVVFPFCNSKGKLVIRKLKFNSFNKMIIFLDKLVGLYKKGNNYSLGFS